ncbi:MAG: hypothetical protein ACR2PK_03435 [Acidimicrobiales bacterium]
MDRLRNDIARRWWDLDRFGLTPRKLKARLSSSEIPGIVCNSVPKAGTHLIERALCLHPDLYRKIKPTLRRRNMPTPSGLASMMGGLKPGQVLLTHLPHSQEAAAAIDRTSVRHLLMVRDPRDIIVSQAHYIPKNSKHAHHELLSSLPDLTARMRMMITGNEATGLVGIRDRLQQYAGWFDTDAAVFRFEDLVGARGGGGIEEQVGRLTDIYNSVGISMQRDEVASLAGKLFSEASPTFRSGSIGQWSEQFDAETADLFNQAAGEMLSLYGYVQA